MLKIVTTLLLISTCTLAQAQDDYRKPKDNFGSAYDPAYANSVSPSQSRYNPPSRPLEPIRSPLAEPISRPLVEPTVEPLFTPSERRVK